MDAFIDEQHLEAEWKGLNFVAKPDFSAAAIEFQKFEHLLKSVAAEINYFDLDESVTIDSIYCRDASIVTDSGIILCGMGKPQRILEPEAQGKIFQRLEKKILGRIELPGTLEGGDVAWLDIKTLAVGLSDRTNSEGIRQLRNLVEPSGASVIEVQLPHHKGPGDVFHLMSVLSPVGEDMVVVFSPLLPIGFRRKLLQRGFRLVEVPENEFETMGCNVLTIAEHTCLMVAGNPVTKSLLEKEGFIVHTYEGKEISLKGGGGPTCLTRPMLREI